MKFSYSTGDQPLTGYTIKRGVGVGGFGEVYFAVNTAGKEVALKRIQRNLEVEVRGVRQCINLKHPNLIAIYDIQFDDQQQGWIVMEYVAGPSLRELIDQHTSGMTTELWRHWFGQMAAAVTYLHDHGLVHRDIKPANVFAEDGLVKIGDYGLSKFISTSRRGGQTESVGTFHYMAPEIGKGEYGKGIDIYALGIVLYEMVTGRLPFDGESSQEIIMKHLTAMPDLKQLDAPIREVIARALQKNPADRFRDVRDMARALGLEITANYQCIDKGAAVSHPSQLEPVIAAITDHGSYQQPSAPVAYTAHATSTGKPSRYTSPIFREPLARAAKHQWHRLQVAWKNSGLDMGTRAVIIAVIIIMTLMNLSLILAVMFCIAACYVPYYLVWLALSGSKPRQSGNEPNAHWPTMSHGTASSIPPVVHPVAPLETAWPVAPSSPGPAVRYPPSQQLSLKQWRVAKRHQLSQAKPSTIATELTGSWISAALVVAVFTALAAVFQMGSGDATQATLASWLWSALMAVLSAVVVITLNQYWQKRESDTAQRWFVQLSCGLVLGLIAYGLSRYLMVAWTASEAIALESLSINRLPSFFNTAGMPQLPAFLAYFSLVMGIVHWWKQADPLRPVRFSLLSVLWSIVVAGLVQLLIPFPQPWGILVFAGTSMAVQLATPWYNPNQRLREPVDQWVA